MPQKKEKKGKAKKQMKNEMGMAPQNIAQITCLVLEEQSSNRANKCLILFIKSKKRREQDQSFSVSLKTSWPQHLALAKETSWFGQLVAGAFNSFGEVDEILAQREEWERGWLNSMLCFGFTWQKATEHFDMMTKGWFGGWFGLVDTCKRITWSEVL